MGYASFGPHPLLHYELLHDYMRRSALSGALGLWGHGLFLHGPLLGCRAIAALAPEHILSLPSNLGAHRAVSHTLSPSLLTAQQRFTFIQ